ncbi:MAG TPA: PAS domain S-box protein [Methanoregulaceae archaeon]|nr:PAS domain S-box protein [Methanoregulaceae archaeon]
MREPLEENESLLRNFFDSSGVMRGIVEVVADDELKHITCNAAAAALIGLTPDAMKNKRSSELGQPPDVIQMWIGHFTGSMISGRPVTFEYRHDRGGEEVWLLNTVSYLGTYSSGFPRFAYVIFDNTKNKQTARALEESQKRYQALTETNVDFIWEMDSEGRYTYCSPQMERLWGIKPDEMIGRTPFDRMPSEERDRLKEAFLGIMKVPQRFEGLESTALDGHGKPIFIETSGVPFFDDKGILLGYRGVTRDITDRQRVQDALVEVNENLEAIVQKRTEELSDALRSADHERQQLYDLLEKLPVYVCLLDEEYRISFANRTFRETFVDPGNQRCYESLFNRTEPCEHCETFTVLRTREPHQGLWTGPNGRDYEIHDIPLKDADGSVRILEMGIDITDRKKAEEENAILASIVAHSDDAIIGKSLDGTIMSWNAGAERIYGYSAREMTGQHISVLMPPGITDEFGYLLDKIRTGETVLHYDTTRVRKDGTQIQVSLVISPIMDSKGTLIGASTIAHDITERKKAEEAIGKAYAYNRSLIEASLDPLVTISPDGTISDVNEATIRITGCSREELIGTDFSDYFTNPSLAETGYQKVFREGSVTDYELEIRHRDGHSTPVLYNAAVYRDISGDVTGVFAAARDITKRKKAEEATERANAYNRSLIEASLDPLVTISPDGTISDANAATIRITGCSREELIGTDFSDYFTNPAMAQAGYEKVFREQSVTDYELEIRHRDGHSTPVLYNAAVYRDISGDVTGVFAAARDITERKNAEDAIRKAHNLLEERVEERTLELALANVRLQDEIGQRRFAESMVKNTLSELYAALESTADGIYVIDREGKIVRYNQNFATMWDIPETLLLSGDDRQVSGYLENQVKKPGFFIGDDGHHGNNYDCETYDMLELKDGRIFERYSKPQKMDTTIIGRVQSYRDVTDRRRAEERLLASLQEKETLIREIHHRVKNNLQIISGLLDMTRMRTSDFTTNSILTDMMMKIKTMAQIHTRLYESKQFDKINMGSQIRDQVVDLSNIYGRLGADIQSEVATEDIFLPVDQAIPCALVVNEILSNAFKHAFRGKKQGMLDVSARQVDGHIHIVVRDDGIGIPDDLDVYRTTSLGLKLIRSLVKQLNGSVTIMSSHGTEVTVEFPLRTGGA